MPACSTVDLRRFPSTDVTHSCDAFFSLYEPSTAVEIAAKINADQVGSVSKITTSNPIALMPRL